MSLYLKSYFDN